MTYALGDEYANQQAGNEEDNGKDDNDTGLTLGPVVTLGQLGHGELAASGDEVRDGGHCVGYGFLQECQSDMSSDRCLQQWHGNERWLASWSMGGNRPSIVPE